MRNGNCERGCEEKLIRKNRVGVVEQEFPYILRTRVHNNFKSEDLIIEQKVSMKVFLTMFYIILDTTTVIKTAKPQQHIIKQKLKNFLMKT